MHLPEQLHQVIHTIRYAISLALRINLIASAFFISLSHLELIQLINVSTFLNIQTAGHLIIIDFPFAMLVYIMVPTAIAYVSFRRMSRSRRHEYTFLAAFLISLVGFRFLLSHTLETVFALWSIAKYI